MGASSNCPDRIKRQSNSHSAAPKNIARQLRKFLFASVFEDLEDLKIFCS